MCPKLSFIVGCDFDSGDNKPHCNFNKKLVFIVLLCAHSTDICYIRSTYHFLAYVHEFATLVQLSCSSVSFPCTEKKAVWVQEYKRDESTSKLDKSVSAFHNLWLECIIRIPNWYLKEIEMSKWWKREWQHREVCMDGARSHCMVYRLF